MQEEGKIFEDEVNERTEQYVQSTPVSEVIKDVLRTEAEDSELNKEHYLDRI